MKKILMIISIVIFVTLPIVNRAQETKIFLDPCMKMCLMFYADNSGSMDSAISDLHRWARSMIIIPTQNGSVEIGLVSFGAGYEVLCEPTHQRTEFLKAVDSLKTRTTENDTRPHYGLEYIGKVFRERKMIDSSEVQILLIHSDYEWYDMCESSLKIEKLISQGVIVILSLPTKYDMTSQGDKRMIHEENLGQVSSLGCINIRSSFNKFKFFLSKLKAIVPCG